MLNVESGESVDWKYEARRRINRFGWKPVICMQGGGARGAWQAGVLSTLMADSNTGEPSAMWGTSAGAINALWAATSQVGGSKDELLSLWLIFAKRIRALAIVVAVLVFTLLVASARVILWHSRRPWLYTVLTVILIAIAVPPATALWAHISRRAGRERLPSLAHVRWLAKLLPLKEGAPRFHSFFCSANVLLNEAPFMWDWDTLGVFQLKPGASCAEYVRTGELVKPSVAAMCSAALPILSRPYKIGGDALVDGGLEANLPAGHIFSQGASGGHSAICIIPRPISELDPKDHVDFRTLTFLSELRKLQFDRRRERAAVLDEGKAWSGSSATTLPILIIEPLCPMRTNLWKGFLCPSMLREAYCEGRREGEKLISALKRFEADEDNALAAYLLEDRWFQEPGDHPPNAAFWKWWVNLQW